MSTLILEPEFFIDFDHTISTQAVVIKDGQILPKGSNSDPKNATKIKLKNQVLMPGFVNAHSHAFQRILRGTVEKSSPTQSDNFWTWRQKMYEIANKLDNETFLAVATLVYLEMLEAGFTHVGEFHYLHHDVGGRSFQDPLAMSKALVQASQNTGINLCLLECVYHRHNFDEALRDEQKRFAFAKVKDFLALLDAAKNELSSDLCTIGLAIHSLRSVPRSFHQEIAHYAQIHNMPLHVHASEQEKEVRDCVKKYGKSPIAMLNDSGLLTSHTTVIHSIHLIDDDINILSTKKPLICLCPSTEKNLGDGVIPLLPLFDKKIRIAIGTDQHVRLDPFHEIQSLEDQERSRLQKRSVLNGNGQWLYDALLPCLTANGLASLYPTSPRHNLANLISLDLPPEYEWHGPKAALDAIILNHNAGHINTVISQGKVVVQNHTPIYSDKSYLIKIINNFFRNIFN